MNWWQTVNLQRPRNGWSGPYLESSGLFETSRPIHPEEFFSPSLLLYSFRKTAPGSWRNAFGLRVAGSPRLDYDQWAGALRSLIAKLDQLGDDVTKAYVSVTTVNSPLHQFRLRIEEIRLLAYHRIRLGTTIAG